MKLLIGIVVSSFIVLFMLSCSNSTESMITDGLWFNETKFKSFILDNPKAKFDSNSVIFVHFNKNKNVEYYKFENKKLKIQVRDGSHDDVMIPQNNWFLKKDTLFFSNRPSLINHIDNQKMNLIFPSFSTDGNLIFTKENLIIYKKVPPLPQDFIVWFTQMQNKAKSLLVEKAQQE